MSVVVVEYSENVEMRYNGPLSFIFCLAGQRWAQLESVASSSGDHQQPWGGGESHLQSQHQPLHLSLEDTLPGHLLHRRRPSLGGWSDQLPALH